MNTQLVTFKARKSIIVSSVIVVARDCHKVKR